MAVGMEHLKMLLLLPAVFVRTGAAAGPCDVYSLHGTPCVAAHSTTRALFGGYDGALFAVKRARDNATVGHKLSVLAGTGTIRSFPQLLTSARWWDPRWWASQSARWWGHTGQH